MLDVKKEGVILNKTPLIFENEGVLNPGIIKEGEYVHMFYRAVSTGNNSSIGYCKLKGPLLIVERDEVPLLFPQFNYEAHGVEDARIVKIEGVYYLTYTAYDGINALGALAISEDMKKWTKLGIIVPQITYKDFVLSTNPHNDLNTKYVRYNIHERLFDNQGNIELVWDKNLIFFPRKIDGKFYFLHRIKPDIQIVVAVGSIEELTQSFWQNYFLNFDKWIVLTPKFDHEVSYIGGGCPPIETKEGWLIIYHGVHDSIKGYVYSACAALLDLNNPVIELARLPYPLFKPELKWELKGEVNNVCFPTGSAIFDDTLYIYYGAADEQIACASVSLSALLKELLLNPVIHA